jgi:hypothetical protein
LSVLRRAKAAALIQGNRRKPRRIPLPMDPCKKGLFLLENGEKVADFDQKQGKNEGCFAESASGSFYNLFRFN